MCTSAILVSPILFKLNDKYIFYVYTYQKVYISSIQ